MEEDAGVGEFGRWTGELALALDETPAQLQPAAALHKLGTEGPVCSFVPNKLNRGFYVCRLSISKSYSIFKKTPNKQNKVGL